MSHARPDDRAEVGGEGAAALPPDDFIATLDTLVATHDPVRQDRLVPAIASGTASRELAARVLLERYYLVRWVTPELSVLIANAPDVYAFTMDHSTHYRHWARRFVDATGYLDGTSHGQATLDLCRQLGLADDQVRAYTPLAETVATVGTMLFYVRRSYEEGVAVVGYLGERTAAGEQVRTLYDGLRAHFGVSEAKGAAGVRGPAAAATGAPEVTATALLRRVAVTRPIQDRCRDAVRNCLLVAEARTRAMNHWLA